MAKSKKGSTQQRKDGSKNSVSSSDGANEISPSSLPSNNDDIFQIFAKIQWTEAFHNKYMKKLKKIYDNTPFKSFVNDFIMCLKKAFITNDKALEKNMEFTLKFAANFTVSLDDPESEETSPFIASVFKFLFENHDCYETAVRLHCCQFINCVLDALGANASLEQVICEKIVLAMIERLQDKVATVRTQAVLALHRLQDPSDGECKVIEVFLYHMTRDPSPDVRSAVINNIVIMRKTLAVILSRINDCKEDVRVDAFSVFIKLSVQKFTIKQRQKILNAGLLDHSTKVKDLVKKKLLPKWLEDCKGDYVQFLRVLSVESELGLEVSIKCLNTIFSQEEKCTLVEYILKHLKQKTIPYDCLSPEIALFWHILAEYLVPPRDSEVSDELFTKIVPELTLFGDYIKGFFLSYNFAGSNDGANKDLEKEFILIQLLELSKCYDLADECGRNNLATVCVSLLKDPLVTLKSIPIIVNRLAWSIPDVTERISNVVELISDLREPFLYADNSLNSSFNDSRNIETMKTQLNERLRVLENEKLEASLTEDMMIAREIEIEIDSIESKLADLNTRSSDFPVNQLGDDNIDPVIVAKCLKIINETIDSRGVTELTPTLRSLFDNVVLPGFKKNLQNSTVSSLSLETFGMFCLLDAQLARERFIVLCYMISTRTLTVPALKAVFDLLQKYGLRTFNLTDEEANAVKEEEDEHNKSRKRKSSSGPASVKYVIPLLYSLLDSDSQEVRNIAAEGLCKLLLFGHLRSHTLVAKLISLWFDPASASEPGFRQRLTVFFKLFVVTPGAQLIMEKAFLPTLQLFFDAAPVDPLSEVNIDGVVQLLINLTHSEFGTSLPKGYCVHNQLASVICKELMHSGHISKERNACLMRALTLLSIGEDDIDFIKELSDQVEILVHKYQTIKERNCHRFAIKLKFKLSTMIRENELKLKAGESEICNTLSSTNITDKSGNASNNKSDNVPEPVTGDMEEDVPDDKTDIEDSTPQMLNKLDIDSAIIVPESDASDSGPSPDLNSRRPNRNSRYQRQGRKASGKSNIVISSSEGESSDEKENVSETGNERRRGRQVRGSQSSSSTFSTDSSSLGSISRSERSTRYNTRSARKNK